MPEDDSTLRASALEESPEAAVLAAERSRSVRYKQRARAYESKVTELLAIVAGLRYSLARAEETIEKYQDERSRTTLELRQLEHRLGSKSREAEMNELRMTELEVERGKLQTGVATVFGALASTTRREVSLEDDGDRSAGALRSCDDGRVAAEAAAHAALASWSQKRRLLCDKLERCDDARLAADAAGHAALALASSERERRRESVDDRLAAEAVADAALSLADTERIKSSSDFETCTDCRLAAEAAGKAAMALVSVERRRAIDSVERSFDGRLAAETAANAAFALAQRERLDSIVRVAAECYRVAQLSAFAAAVSSSEAVSHRNSCGSEELMLLLQETVTLRQQLALSGDRALAAEAACHAALRETREWRKVAASIQAIKVAPKRTHDDGDVQNARLCNRLEKMQADVGRVTHRASLAKMHVSTITARLESTESKLTESQNLLEELTNELAHSRQSEDAARAAAVALDARSSLLANSYKSLLDRYQSIVAKRKQHRSPTTKSPLGDGFKTPDRQQRRYYVEGDDDDGGSVVRDGRESSGRTPGASSRRPHDHAQLARSLAATAQSLRQSQQELLREVSYY